MSKNLFESLKAAHHPIDISAYGKQCDSENLQNLSRKLDDIDGDGDASSLDLEIDNEKTCNESSEDGSGDSSFEVSNTIDKEFSKIGITKCNEVRAKSKTGMIKSRSTVSDSSLVKQHFGGSFVCSEKEHDPLDEPGIPVEKNIWKQLSYRLSSEDCKGTPLSLSSVSDNSNMDMAPPCLTPIQDSPKSVVDAQDYLDNQDNFEAAADNQCRKIEEKSHACTSDRKIVSVGPLVECTSEVNSEDDSVSVVGQLFADAKHNFSKRRNTDNYSIESGEILSSEDGSVEDETKKDHTDDESNSVSEDKVEETEDDNNVHENVGNEEAAEDTEDTEWCSEGTHPLNDESDEDTERASIDSEMNDLIIAFPCEEGTEVVDDALSISNLDKDFQSDSRKEFQDSVGNTEDSIQHSESATEAPPTEDSELESSTTKTETADEQSMIEAGRSELVAKTKLISSVKEEAVDDDVKSKVPTRSSIRQVSFFEKAADFFCINLLENDVTLSPPSKSVFNNFVKQEEITTDGEPSSSCLRETMSEEESAQTSSSIKDAPDLVKDRSSIDKASDVSHNPLLFESCSLNEILMKEEEAEEQDEENENEFNCSTKRAEDDEMHDDILSKIDKSSKSEDSRLSLISQRLRNRMPHWDDSFNEAFMPQIRCKSSLATKTNSSPASSNHSASDSSKRSKAAHQSSDIHSKSTMMHDTYRDPITFVPQHVKKVRQFLTTFSRENEEKNVETTNIKRSSPENIGNRTVHIKMGCPNPKGGLRARKYSYHDSKKALRLPQKLIRNLPSPTIKTSDEDGSATTPGQTISTTASVEFRSSLGASVRTKPRAFTKAALRRQIVEEASTAKPQFRVKTRPTSDDGTGSLAIVITRVTLPPLAKRSFSASLSDSQDADAKSGTEHAISRSKDDAFVGSEIRFEGKEKANVGPISDVEDNKQSISVTNSNETEIKDKFPSENIIVKRRKLESDDIPVSMNKSYPHKPGESSQSSKYPSAQSPSKSTPHKNSMHCSSDTDESRVQTFDESASSKNAVNFRGVASNRKRLKSQRKPRLLQEIENTSGFLMDKGTSDREQRALERLLQNVELHSGNSSEKQADSSVHSSPRVVLNRLSPEDVKANRGKSSKRSKNSNRPEPRRDYKSQKSDSEPRKLKNAVNAANRITAKYAARGGTNTNRELVSVHPRVRGILKRSSGRDMYGRTALHLAAALGQLESVMYCLKLNMDVNDHDHSGLYPIHAASRSGSTAVIKALLEAGADVNIRAEADGLSPLHEAACSGKMDAVMELLTNGADRTLTTYDGTTPADFAANEDIRSILEGNKPSMTQSSEASNSAFVTEDIQFELYDKVPPIVFTLWLESTQAYSEVVLLSELCEFCKLDKVNIRIKKPSIHIVKVSMDHLFKGMRNSYLWPALRLRLRIEGSLQDHKSNLNRTRALIALVVYSEEIQAFICGVSMTLTHEEVKKVKDPPKPPVPKKRLHRKRIPQKRPPPISVTSMATERPNCPKESVCKASKGSNRPPSSHKLPSPIEVFGRERDQSGHATEITVRANEESPNITRNLKVGTHHDTSESSSDEDVVITGIFSAPKKPASVPSSPNTGVSTPVTQQRKRPVASVIPNRVHPQNSKQMRMSLDPDSDDERKVLREEYMRACEKIKLERRNLEKKEMQLREKLLAMNDPRKKKIRRISDDKTREHQQVLDNLRFNAPPNSGSKASSPERSRALTSPTLAPMSSVNNSRDLLNDLPQIPQIDLIGIAPLSPELDENRTHVPTNPVKVTPIIPVQQPITKPESSRIISKPISPVRDPIIVNRRNLCGIRMAMNNRFQDLSSPLNQNSTVRFASVPSSRQSNFPVHQPCLRTKLVPSHPYIGMKTSTNRFAIARQPTDCISVVNGVQQLKRFIPASSNNAIISGSHLMTRCRPTSNVIRGPPPILGAPQIDISVPPTIDNSRKDFPSPPGSPPLLVPQGPLTIQNTASRKSPIPNSTPPLLFPQEPPVLLPCPKIADSTYPINNTRPDNSKATDKDETPPQLIPSNAPAGRTIKCASDLLKKPTVSASNNASAFASKATCERDITAPGTNNHNNAITLRTCNYSNEVSIDRLDSEAGPPKLTLSSTVPIQKYDGNNSDNAKPADSAQMWNLATRTVHPNEGNLRIPSATGIKGKPTDSSTYVTFSFNRKRNSEDVHPNSIDASVSLASEQKQHSKSAERRRKRPMIRFHSDGETISICSDSKTSKRDTPQTIDLTESVPSPPPSIGKVCP